MHEWILTDRSDEVSVAARHSIDVERCVRNFLSCVLDAEGVMSYVLRCVGDGVRAVGQFVNS